MTPETSADRELLYSEVTDTILSDLRAGRQPDLDTLSGRYPHLAGDLAAHVDQLATLLRVPSPSATGQPPCRLGDFYLLREVGRGGMGVVYEAIQISEGRRVALKLLPNATLLDPLRRQRFQQEAQAAARLHHPHVVPVLAVSCDNELPYYAMQFIEGPSIAELVDRRGKDPSPLDDAEYVRMAAHWARQAAEALHYAHEVGVIHRDVKPANLLIDDSGSLWITDFGLARIRGEAGLTATGNAVGTLRYMSPEQAQGAHGVTDHRVDVYGLGLTLYELVTLQPAIPGEDRGEQLHRLLHGEPKQPRSLDPTIPHDLETIILKAIRKDPAERYATAAAMAEDLQRFLDSQPVRARRPTRRQRTQAWLRRHAVGVASALVVLMVISTILAVSTVLIGRAYEDARHKQALAEHRRAYAERSRAVARRAVDQVLTGVVRDWLDGDADLEPIQRQLLEQLRSCCQELAQEDPNDAEANFRVAEAMHYVAAIDLRLGRHDAAERSSAQALAKLAGAEKVYPAHRYLRAKCLSITAWGHRIAGERDRAKQVCEEAVALTDELATEFPNEPVYRAASAAYLLNLAFLYQSDRRGLDQADALFNRAINLCTGLVQDVPAAPEHQYRLANAQSDYATLLISTGRLAPAETMASEAVATFRRLLNDRPANRFYRDQLAMGLTNLAQVLIRTQRAAEAVSLSEEAVKISARLANEYPAAPSYRDRHAGQLGILAEGLARTGQLHEAEQANLQAAEMYRSLVKEHPKFVVLRLPLAEILVRLGACREKMGRRADAEPAYCEGLDLLFQVLHDDPRHHVGRQDLGKTLPNVRHVQGAGGQLAQAAAYQQKVADQLRHLAQREPEEQFWQRTLSDTLGFLGALHLVMGQRDGAEKHYRQQREVLEALAKPSPNTSPQAAFNLAWFHSDCPLKSLRNPELALALARQAWDAQPTRSLDSHVILAAANNGVGDHAEAAKVLEPLTDKLPGAMIDFWRHWAIAQHHLGKADQARAGLNKVVRWVQSGGVLAVEHKLLLPEVNELLGNPEPILAASP